MTKPVDSDIREQVKQYCWGEGQVLEINTDRIMALIATEKQKSRDIGNKVGFDLGFGLGYELGYGVGFDEGLQAAEQSLPEKQLYSKDKKEFEAWGEEHHMIPTPFGGYRVGKSVVRAQAHANIAELRKEQ